MDRYITKSKYFSSDFNTAIFSDPIRIYFSQEQESQALHIYFRLQSRKNEWERFLRERGKNNFCYIMIYNDKIQFDSCFEDDANNFAPGEMGEDYILGINGPMTDEVFEEFIEKVDATIGFEPATQNQ